MKRAVRVLMLAGVMQWTEPAAVGQAGQNLEYEVFCKLPDAQTKRDAFMATSPDNRAVLVRAQLERWRDANRPRLNDKQLAAMEMLIASITADTYGEGPKAEDARTKARPLAEAQRQLFTTEDMQAMQPTGPCIAKVK